MTKQPALPQSITVIKETVLLVIHTIFMAEFFMRFARSSESRHAAHPVFETTRT